MGILGRGEIPLIRLSLGGPTRQSNGYILFLELQEGKKITILGDIIGVYCKVGVSGISNPIYAIIEKLFTKGKYFGVNYCHNKRNILI